MDRVRRRICGHALNQFLFRASFLRLALAVPLFFAATACAAVDTDGVEALATPSRATFTDEAEPLLEKRCADGACHGMDRPYSLYAIGQRRQVAADIYSPKPLTDAEIDANYVATLGFLDAPRPVDTTLLRKALGQGGPGGHRGGVVFEAPSDPECRAIVRWITGSDQ